MKSRIFLGLALATAIALPAWAADSRTIAMTGHGETRGAPDMAQVTAGVSTMAPTAAQALSANSSHMKGVFAALVKLGVPERNIQTSNFFVSPQYSNGDNNTPRRLTGYQVNNDVTVRLEDVGKLGGALDALVAAGANQINGVSFSIQNSAPLLEKARADAVADARARAQTYAKAAGVTLGPILSISEGGAEAPPRPMFRVAAIQAETRIAPGEQSVTADVTMVWEIH
ncbi:MAG TPA: SIMPL domain-containing protein [Rhizomicrobium sp.]|nr:SIMPL domain-containing protein [Rhizomicrobium sp.]